MSSLTSRSTNYTLPEKAVRAEYIERNFDAIARNYDRFNDRITFGFHRLWKNRMVDLAIPIGARSALDLCCGTGDVSLRIARKIGDSGTVVALDFSQQMLDVLSARVNQTRAARELGLAEIEITRGDATDLSAYASNTFDGVTISFGLRNVQDRPAALQEIQRVLKPGHRLVVLDVGEVAWRIPAFFHSLFFERIVPIIGHWTHGEKHEMYDYLPASAKEYPNQIALKKELEDLGFVRVRYQNLFLGSAALHIAEKLAPE